MSKASDVRVIIRRVEDDVRRLSYIAITDQQQEVVQQLAGILWSIKAAWGVPPAVTLNEQEEHA